MFTVLETIKPPLYPKFDATSEKQSCTVNINIILSTQMWPSNQFHPCFFLQNVLAKQAVHQTLFMIYSHNSSLNVLYGREVLFIHPFYGKELHSEKCVAIGISASKTNLTLT